MSSLLRIIYDNNQISRMINTTSSSSSSLSPPSSSSSSSSSILFDDPFVEGIVIKVKSGFYDGKVGYVTGIITSSLLPLCQ